MEPATLRFAGCRSTNRARLVRAPHILYKHLRLFALPFHLPSPLKSSVKLTLLGESWAGVCKKMRKRQFQFWVKVLRSRSKTLESFAKIQRPEFPRLGSRQSKQILSSSAGLGGARWSRAPPKHAPRLRRCKRAWTSKPVLVTPRAGGGAGISQQLGPESPAAFLLQGPGCESPLCCLVSPFSPSGTSGSLSGSPPGSCSVDSGGSPWPGLAWQLSSPGKAPEKRCPRMPWSRGVAAHWAAGIS